MYGKNFLDDYNIIIPLMYNFQSLSNKFPTILWSFIFYNSHTRLGYFSWEKGNLNFSDS